MTYAQKLRSPLWQKKRLKILERDKWSCCSCRTTTKNLQVHHLYYAKKEPWQYPDEAYQTLCEDCHEVRQELANPIIDEIKVLVGKIPICKIESLLYRAKDFLESEILANQTKPKEIDYRKPISRASSKEAWDAIRAGDEDALKMALKRMAEAAE